MNTEDPHSSVGRPYPRWRLDAKDHGILFRDRSSPADWRCALAISNELIQWKKGDPFSVMSVILTFGLLRLGSLSNTVMRGLCFITRQKERLRAP